MPVVASPPATPFTFQVTAVLVVFNTVAENCCVAFRLSSALEGVIFTAMGVTVLPAMVTEANPTAAGTARLVA